MAFFNRFTATTRGGIRFVGNTLGLSKFTNQNSAGTEGSIGAFTTLLGGTVSRNNIATSGSFSTDMLSHINIETAFLAATAFTEDRGFTCGSQSESEIKSYVLKNAKRRIMLLDSTKLGKIMPYTFAAFGDIDVLISDSEFPQELRDKARTLGIIVE